MQRRGTQAGGGDVARIESVRSAAYVIPTDNAESDGTLLWHQTTMVSVRIWAGGVEGFGYTYADPAAGSLINRTLAPLLENANAFEHRRLLSSLLQHVRNIGQTGLVAMAISAVDAALWDLRGRLLGQPVAKLLGLARTSVPIYGSGGFTSLDEAQLHEQLAGWVDRGIRRVKMKVGTHPEDDAARVRIAREAIGDDAQLFVDGNGAYSEKRALDLAERFAEQRVTWFEEPVSSDDLSALARIRQRLPVGMELAAGEYADGPRYVRRMLEADAVDVMQVDATRALGITGVLDAGALCDAFEVPLSTHCAPSLHLHVSCAVPRFRHLEFFFDHVRIERELFDGFVEPRNGELKPDLSRPGLGFDFKRTNAEQYAVAV